jgi:hypothetical protein
MAGGAWCRRERARFVVVVMKGRTHSGGSIWHDLAQFNAVLRSLLLEGLQTMRDTARSLPLVRRSAPRESQLAWALYLHTGLHTFT